MSQPGPTAEVTWTAQRGVPFIDRTAYLGFDYREATFTVEVRRYRDQSGTPLLALTNATANAQGVSVEYREVDGVPLSIVQTRINETSVEGLPFTSPRGGNVELQFAQDIAGGGHIKQRRQQGPLIVEASANG